jgi:hypothetical protein
MKSKVHLIPKKKKISIRMWIGLIISFVGIMSFICLGFYILLISSTGNIKSSPQASINTDLPPVVGETITAAINPLLVNASSATPQPQPTLAPTWTPEPTLTPFVLTTLQTINPSSNSVCSWMENIEGVWVSDIWGQIVTFYPNGEYVQLDKKLVNHASTMSLQGKYECTSEGYIRILLYGEEIFATSIVKVNITGRNMKWTLVDDNDSDGHGSDIIFPFVKK